MRRITRAGCALTIVLLSACGRSETSNGTANNETQMQPQELARTCENIRSNVIHTAAANGVTIVKIYEPATLKSSPTEVSCKGSALLSDGQTGAIYYRDFQDKDGDWLVQYAEKPLG